MTIIKFAFILLLLNTLLYTSCKPKEHFAGEKKYQPEINLKPGDSYYYTINSTSETNLKVEGKAVENSNSSLAGLLFEVIKDTANGSLLQVTYDSLHTIIKNGDMKKEMDAPNAAYSLDPTERMLGRLKGSRLTVFIDNKGSIVFVNGYTELTNRLLASVEMSSTDKQKMEQQVESLLGEGFLTNNLSQTFGLFPDSAVYVGDSWTKTSKQTGDLKLDLNTQYTLTSVEDSVAAISSKAIIHGNAMNIMGYEVRVNVTGKDEGHYNVDMHNGMLIAATSATKIKGTVVMMGREVPVEIKAKKEIKVEKL